MKILKNACKQNSIIRGKVVFHKDSCCGSRA